MSSDITQIYVGVSPNDGTGEPIRDAFQITNTNFTNLDTRISTGNIAQVYATIGVTGQYLVSNSSTITNSLRVNSNATLLGETTIDNAVVSNLITASDIQVNNNASVGGSLTVGGNTAVTGSVVITGNLTVLGNSVTINSSDLAIKDSIINLHTDSSLAPLAVDDGKDIGIQFHYFKDSDKHAALVWANDSQALEFYSEGVESAANTFTGTYGHFKVGSLFVGNTGAAITTTGNISADSLSLTGGFEANSMSADTATFANLSVTNKVIGSLYLSGGDTIYVNGSPVSTAASSFGGGVVPNYTLFNTLVEAHGNIFANSGVPSLDTQTGALTVRGGAGISGSIYAGAIEATPIGAVSPSTGAFTSISISDSFAANNVTFTGGTITGVAGQADTWDVGVLTTSNVQITGGAITNTPISGSTGSFTSLTSASFTAASINNTPIGNAVPSTGAFTSLNSLTGINISGTAGRIISDFTTSTTPANRTIFQTNVTNGATIITAMPRGAIVAGALASGIELADSATMTTGNGNSAMLQVIQDTEIRIQSAAHGAALNIPLTIWTGGSKAMSVSPTHDVAILTQSGVTNTTLLADGTINAIMFNGVAATAKYADLAELYSADTVYAPGTVLIFGGDKEVTTTNEYANTSVAGVVSTKPAYLMNSDLKDGTPIALRGRVPVNVIGRVSKGDLLITSNTPGFATSAAHNKSMGPSVFAKAIEDKHTDGPGTIEAVIL